MHEALGQVWNKVGLHRSLVLVVYWPIFLLDMKPPDEHSSFISFFSWPSMCQWLTCSCSSDILDAVVSLSPIPPTPEKESRKRTRNPETVEPDIMESDSTTRQFAGSKRVLNTLNPVFSGFNELTSIDYAVFNPFNVINTEQQYSFSVEDPDPILHLDYHEPTVEPSAWSDPRWVILFQAECFVSLNLGFSCYISNEEWSSFMSRVDELLRYTNPDAL